MNRRNTPRISFIGFGAGSAGHSRNVPTKKSG
jgi:hypothetical protein